MNIVTKIVANASELKDIKKDLDIFLNIYCKNPFSLYPFIENYMRSFCQDSIPMILVSSVKDKIVGLAPLQLRKNLVFQNAAFLLPTSLSPDFVVTDEYRKEVLHNFLRIIFERIKCKEIVLDLPAESQNLPVLERVCIAYNLTVRKQFPENTSHCLISALSSLDEFENFQGRETKRKFKRILRNFDKTGAWKLVLVEDWCKEQDAQNAFDKMMAIEEMSWKEEWRLKTGSTNKRALVWIWHSALLAAKSNPDFKFKSWFLELNDQAIAYDLIIEYKKTAFFTNTSYVQKYRQLYPGILMCNALIEDQFRRREVESIDFLTNLPYMKRWNVICAPRVRYKLNEDSVSNLFRSKLTAVLDRFWNVKKNLNI